MAIGTAYILSNSSVIPDEMLVHRIGLLPIKADPSMFDMQEEPGLDHANNCLIFKLHAKCQNNPRAQKGSTDPKEIYIGSSIYAKNLYSLPQPTQLERLQSRRMTKYDEMFADYWKSRAVKAGEFSKEYEPPISAFNGVNREDFQNLKAQYWPKFEDHIRWAHYPLHENIVLDKLRPGQVVDIQVHIRKGIGRDHAKWSPCNASYRLLPDIIITQPIRGKDAEKFAGCFPPGVIGLKTVVIDGKPVKEAFVKDSRMDTVTRECLRHPEFRDKVVLSRVRDHFICIVSRSLCLIIIVYS